MVGKLDLHGQMLGYSVFRVDQDNNNSNSENSNNEWMHYKSDQTLIIIIRLSIILKVKFKRGKTHFL